MRLISAAKFSRLASGVSFNGFMEISRGEVLILVFSFDLKYYFVQKLCASSAVN